MPLKSQDRIRLVITTWPCFVIYDNYGGNNLCIVGMEQSEASINFLSTPNQVDTSSLLQKYRLHQLV